MGYYDNAILKDIEQLGKLLTQSENLPDGTLPRLPRQQITYGAPGTGKSFGIDEDVKKYHMTAIRTTFHPDSDYSTFVGAYKPKMVGGETRQYPKDELIVRLTQIKNSGATYPCHKFAAIYWESLKDLSAADIKEIINSCGFTEPYYQEVNKGIAIGQDFKDRGVTAKKIAYSFTQQAFLKAYIAAWKDLENPYVLVIEEINRGNCAQIFGDLFQLLDRNDEGFSSYPISPDTDIMQVLNDEFDGLEIPEAEAINGLYTEDVMSGVLDGSKLLLPRNLYIWATMNTSDQSLFPIDSAFKRRWEWKYVPISDAHKEWRVLVNGVRYDWWSFLDKINDKIWDATRSEDKKLGYFFCKANAEDGIITADKFVGKVLFYIYNDVFKDYGFDDAIFKDENDKENPELLFKDFFLPDGKPREEKIKVFLKNLGVKTEAEIEDETSSNQENTVSDIDNASSEESATVNEPEGDSEMIALQGNDNTKYSFDGAGDLGKGLLAVRIIEKFIAEHPEYTFDQLKETFPDSMMGSNLKLLGLLVKTKDLENAPYNYQKKVYGYYKSDRKKTSGDGVEFCISNNWNITNIQSIIDFANNQGWEVKVNK